MASRTVTGTYRIRPNKYLGYYSSGNFLDYFKDLESDDTSSLSSGTPSGGWAKQFSDPDPTDRCIGDVSNDTYVSTPNVKAMSLNWRGKCAGQNGRWGLHVVLNSVPEFDYTITKVVCYAKIAQSASGNANSTAFFWCSLTGSNDNTYTYKFGEGEGYTSSITQKSWSSTTQINMPANKIPYQTAVCMAGSGRTISTVNWYRCYDVWFEISYSYVENEETVHFNRDSGTIVETEGVDVPTGDYTAWRHTTWTLTASSSPGRSFDGWYLNGQKVSSSNTYTYELYNNDRLYVLSDRRQIFVGTTQIREAYSGNALLNEIYNGDTCVYGKSELYDDATDTS